MHEGAELNSSLGLVEFDIRGQTNCNIVGRRLDDRALLLNIMP